MTTGAFIAEDACLHPRTFRKQLCLIIFGHVSAILRILTGTRDTALMVPEVAIAGFDGFRGQVWTVRDGRLVLAELTFGARDDRGRIEVTGGLPDGAQIVASPPQGANDGRLARIGEGP